MYCHLEFIAIKSEIINLYNYWFEDNILLIIFLSKFYKTHIAKFFLNKLINDISEQ